MTACNLICKKIKIARYLTCRNLCLCIQTYWKWNLFQIQFQTTVFLWLTCSAIEKNKQRTVKTWKINNLSKKKKKMHRLLWCTSWSISAIKKFAKIIRYKFPFQGDRISPTSAVETNTRGVLFWRIPSFKSGVCVCGGGGRGVFLKRKRYFQMVPVLPFSAGNVMAQGGL